MKYLLITFFRKPGGQIDEQVTVSKRIKPADIQSCNVILDFATKTVVKSVIEGKRTNPDWVPMRDYYSKVYPNLIAQLETENATPVDKVVAPAQ